MQIYQVKDWDNHFENYKSRDRDKCSFVCIPNKQDGMGLTRILAEKDGATIYGIWNLILGALSRQGRPREGWMTEDGYQTGTPWIPQDLALRWRRPIKEIERALDVLSSPEVGWVIVSGEGDGSIRSVSDQYPEGKGREGKGKEKKGIQYTLDFDSFWNSYPHSSNRAVKSQTFRNWKRLLKEGIEAGDLLKCSDNYSEEVRIQRTEQTYIIMASNFVGQARRFEPFMPGEWTPPEPPKDNSFGAQMDAMRKFDEEETEKERLQNGNT